MTPPTLRWTSFSPKGTQKSYFTQITLRDGRAVQLNLPLKKHRKIFWGSLEILEMLAEQLDLDLLDVQEVFIENEQVKVEVQLQEDDEPIAWELFTGEASQLLPAAPQVPTPDPETVQGFPQISESWGIHQFPFAFVQDQLAYIILVVTEEGIMRHFKLSVGKPGDTALFRDTLLEACATQFAPGSQQHRPSRVLVQDSDLLFELYSGFQQLGMELKPGLLPAWTAAQQALLQDLGTPCLPALKESTSKELQAFVDAAQAFLKARPWEKLAPDEFIAFRLTGEPWHYASVMGQAGEVMGLSLFADWWEVCKLYNARRSFLDAVSSLMGDQIPAELEAARHAESLMFSECSDLHPEDAHRLLPLWPERLKNEFPLLIHQVYRPESEQLEMAPMRFTLQQVTVLLNAIAERVQKARGKTIGTMKVKTAEMELRFPAEGSEQADARFYSVEFTYQHWSKRTKPITIRSLVQGDVTFRTFKRTLKSQLRAAGIDDYLMIDLVEVMQPELLANLHAENPEELPEIHHLSGDDVYRNPTPTFSMMSGKENLFLEYTRNHQPFRVQLSSLEGETPLKIEILTSP